MKIEVPIGISAAKADLGQMLEFTLPSPGTTGYRWELPACQGSTVERQCVRPGTLFGGIAREVFQVTPTRKGKLKLCWELRAPWQAEPIEIRVLTLEVR